MAEILTSPNSPIDLSSQRAKTGFILSLISLIPEPFMSLFWIGGVVFSLLGLKSAKRKLAIWGLVIATVELLVVSFTVSWLYGIPCHYLGILCNLG